MRVIIFGFGENGKKLIDECLEYDSDADIVAIADNKCAYTSYRNIEIIGADKILQYCFDEIWISTVYFKSIRKQLVDLGISEDKIFFMEPVLPILENRLKQSNDWNNPKYINEIEYIKNNHLRMFCYSFFNEYLEKETDIYWDEMSSLFYGYYEGNRMYLSDKFDTVEKARMYFNSVIMEQDRRSPHCYWNNSSIEQQLGVAVDIGAAEGIYGLKIINQIEHLYLIEAESGWIRALNLTFGKYADKVSIIHKFAGNSDDKDSVRLDTLFANEKVDTIKMDIEGAEMSVLQGAAKIISRDHPRIVSCVYHNANDNLEICEYLLHKGYKVSNSKGFVVCQGDWELDKADVGFRKALVFGE